MNLSKMIVVLGAFTCMEGAAHCNAYIGEFGTCNPNAYDHHSHSSNGSHVPNSELPISIGYIPKYYAPRAVKKIVPITPVRKTALRLFGSRETRGGTQTNFEQLYKEAHGFYNRQYNHDGKHRYLDPKIMRRARQLHGIEQLTYINRVLNQVPYRDDTDRFGREYITNPVDFLTFGGDCDDAAFAKYVFLLGLGWSENDLRIVHLTNKDDRGLHAALVVTPKDKNGNYLEPILMDNGAITKKLVNPEKISSYSINYSFNQYSRWTHSG